LLPAIAAMYTTRTRKLLRQLAVEIHSASTKDAKIRQLLRQALDANIQQIRSEIVGAQQAGVLDPTVDSELLASCDGIHHGIDAYGDTPAASRG